MKNKKIITILVMCILTLSFVSAAYGIFSNDGASESEFVSIHGETISIFGKGLYKNDSVSTVAQAKAQDVVTILIGIPLLIIGLYLFRKNSLKGKLLLTGTLGYFLYTYLTYTFVAMYNSFFLIYVALMGLSFFGFILCMMSFNTISLKESFKDTLPVKFIGGFLIFLTVAVTMMWLGRLTPINSIPPQLEHYTTMVIQGIDLGIVLPTAFVTSLLLFKRNAYGYLLAPIFIIKFLTLSTAITAMVIGQMLAGIELSVGEIIIFPLINVIMIYCLYVVLRNVKKNVYQENVD